MTDKNTEELLKALEDLLLMTEDIPYIGTLGTEAIHNATKVYERIKGSKFPWVYLKTKSDIAIESALESLNKNNTDTVDNNGF